MFELPAGYYTSLAIGGTISSFLILIFSTLAFFFFLFFVVMIGALLIKFLCAVDPKFKEKIERETLLKKKEKEIKERVEKEILEQEKQAAAVKKEED